MTGIVTEIEAVCADGFCGETWYFEVGLQVREMFSIQFEQKVIQTAGADVMVKSHQG